MELKGENISFKYQTQKFSSKENWVLKDLNISLKSGEVLGLFGDSGSGKSTLCKILAGFNTHYEGNVKLDDQIIKPNKNKGFNPIQLIYQHPEKTMNPKWKMKQVLDESWDVDDALLDEFGIQKSWFTRWPNELSGGELQRFSVLRSLNPKTKFLIADEMTTMLDAITQVQILTSVLKIAKTRDMGVLIVSHDKKLLNELCDNIIYLNDINNLN